LRFPRLDIKSNFQGKKFCRLSSEVSFFLNFSEYRIWYRQTTKIKIWFLPEAAEYKKEKKWHESQEILEQKDDSIIFKRLF